MKVPRCLAIIPDGNRRWAMKHSWSTSGGHSNGLKNCLTIARAAFDRGVEHVAFWAMSEENLRNRPVREVEYLFDLLKSELRRRLKEPEEVCFHLCGAWQEFRQDTELVELIDLVHAKSERHTKHHLTVLFGYGGWSEIESATIRLWQQNIPPTRAKIWEKMWTHYLPSADLLIRTGVESDPHWSDLFLPMQIRGTQLRFEKIYWPEFGVEHLEQAFEDFSNRARRRGA